MTWACLFAAAWGQDLDPRRTADAAEQAGDYAGAVASLRECVATASDRDRAYCNTRLGVLEPQAADNFVGWRVLEQVRRDGALGRDDARAAIQAAHDQNPDGPAAAHLARWLAHDELRRGAEGATPVAAGDEAWLAEQRAFEARAQRHAWVGRAGLVLAGGYLLAAMARGIARAPTRIPAGRGVPVAGIVLLAGGPLVLATAFDPENLAPFALSGAVVTACLLAARRCHPAVAGLGTLGALSWVASTNDWLASMGIP